jgi:hypothetical protein
LSKENGDKYYEPALFRLQGEFSKVQDKTVEAQSCLRETIEIAQHQANLLEFRGIMSR